MNEEMTRERRMSLLFILSCLVIQSVVCIICIICLLRVCLTNDVKVSSLLVSCLSLLNEVRDSYSFRFPRLLFDGQEKVSRLSLNHSFHATLFSCNDDKRMLRPRDRLRHTTNFKAFPGVFLHLIL